MITLYLTAKLTSVENAILFSKDLTEKLKEFEVTTQIFNKFCSVCRIFKHIISTIINEDLDLVSKIRFEIHSGSMFQDEEWLYRELDILIHDLHKSSIEFSLTKHT